MTACECTGPGFCKRHGVEKNDFRFNLCQTNSGMFAAWENGFGPGQTPGVASPDPAGKPPLPRDPAELSRILTEICPACECHRLGQCWATVRATARSGVPIARLAARANSACPLGAW